MQAAADFKSPHRLMVFVFYPDVGPDQFFQGRVVKKRRRAEVLVYICFGTDNIVPC